MNQANFTFPMGTGALGLLLHPASQPHTFPGLETIGRVVFIFDLVVFSATTAAITYRFIRWPHKLKRSLVHPTESIFFAASLLAVCSIIGCIGRYGVPHAGDWLKIAYRALYWLYFNVALISAVGHYTLLFSSKKLKVQDMTPAWDLPIFPVMLCGTAALIGAPFQPMWQKIPMIVSGLMAQGLGFMVSILMYSIWYWRMIQYGFPAAQSRPGMFIAVGPPSFTSLAMIGLANAWPAEDLPYFGGGSGEITKQVLMVMSTVIAVFIWGLSFWFFCIAVVGNLLVSVPFCARKDAIHFAPSWWAFVFPNVGFTLATISIGRQLDSQGILWVGSAMTIIIVVVYLFVLVHHVLAVWRRVVLWPGHDEDTYIFEGITKCRSSRSKTESKEGLLHPHPRVKEKD
jgi:C4-dicarboxylate transporter/malic acid transport protein